MRIQQAIGLTAIASVASCTLTACSLAIPIAFYVEDDTVDIAFCESFYAASLEIQFSNYPPPFMGPMFSIAVRTASGPESAFGDGKPVSISLEGWEFSSASDPIPDDWERVDFSFYDEQGEYVSGHYLFSRDVSSSEWTWLDGFNVSSPQCTLDLD